MPLRLFIAAFVVTVPSLAHSDELPPGVENTQDPADVSLSPEATRQLIRVPDGFAVTLFAGEPDIRRPLAFDFDDRGRLWVVENYAHPDWNPERRVDRVVILEDGDRDGRFDKRSVFWDEGRFLTGIAYGHGGIYLCDGPELIFLADRDRDDRPDGAPEVLLDGWSLENLNNLPNHLTWAPDGWLWGCVGVGGESLVGPPDAPSKVRETISRGIWRYHPLQRRFEVLAHGCVNPWGVDFDRHGDAFNTNTVTAHLWHVVPGAYFQRRRRETDNPFAYERIESIADHLHWGGGHWASSRGGKGKHQAAGGGHAHTSAMIYLGDNWPDEYRDGFFTGNLHGNRINHDRLTPHGSTYVGTHADDVLTCDDPWFRPLELKYGPTGSVYVSDWHDTGECHDSDGSHRTSGRIYRIAYGQTPLEPFDLTERTDKELVELLRHQNQWYVRHAGRLLQERAARRAIANDAVERLAAMLADSAATVRLRAMWTLSAVELLPETKLSELLDDPDEHVRWWAVRLLVDQGHTPTVRFVEMAERERAARVRLELASAAGRLVRRGVNDAVSILSTLARRRVDHDDPALPQFLWYGLEPAVADLGLQAYDVAGPMPLLVRSTTRRLLASDARQANAIFDYAGTLSGPARRPVLEGLLAAAGSPTSVVDEASRPYWIERVRGLQAPGCEAVATRLLVALGDQDLLQQLIDKLTGPRVDTDEKLSALQLLLDSGYGPPAAVLHDLIAHHDGALQLAAIRGLQQADSRGALAGLLELYDDLPGEARRVAVEVMTTDRQTALQVLDALDSGRVSRGDISAYAEQQLRSYDHAEVHREVERLLGPTVTGSKSAELARYEALLTPEFVTKADPARGRELFSRRCASCHRLFGHGGDLGPDLTGSQRTDLDYVLRNLIDPSALVDRAYRVTTIVTDDGRLYSGFLAGQNDHELTLRTVQGPVTFATESIEAIETSDRSMMPDGLLRTFTDDQLGDLVAYLARPSDLDSQGRLRTKDNAATE